MSRALGRDAPRARPPSARPAEPRHRGAVRVWVLDALLAAAFVALLLGRVRGLDGPAAGPRPPWVIVAALFAVTEVFVVHLRFRSEAHSISLNEIPLVLGLFFLDPTALITAQLAGAGLALVAHRRQSPVKLAFNLAQLGLGTSLAVLVFHLGPVPDGQPGVAAWGLTLAAAAVASLVGVATIACAISISEGRLIVHKWLPVVGLTLGGMVVNTALALVTVTVVLADTAAVALLAVPAGALVLAYRAWVAERQKHDRIEFLYRTSRILDDAPQREQGVLGVLSEAARVFHAETAQLTLLGTSASEQGRRALVRRGELCPLTAVDLGALDEALTERLDAHGSLLLPDDADGVLGALLTERGIRTGMVAPIRVEQRVAGMMLIENRLGRLGRFARDELRLLQMLAGQAGGALENGRLEQTLKHQAFHDPLTGLANRALFIDRVRTALAGGGGPLAVLFIDLDDFKTINDSLGHAGGDQVLVWVAQRLLQCVRPGDTTARLGGDEFAVLLEGIGGLSEATSVADRLAVALREAADIGGAIVPVSASTGIATSLEGVADADALLRNADVAMYAAKSSGKRRHEVFRPRMHAPAQERRSLRTDLENALLRGELVTLFQPIVGLGTGRVVGAEALVRWNHPHRGVLEPREFVPLAEETGQIVDIGRQVLEEACRQARRWEQRSGAEHPVYVSVNVSGRQLEDRRLPGDLSAILAETEVDPSLVTLEVTEGTASGSGAAASTLRAVRALGVRLAIDDFGTGRASLSCVRDLPWDLVKIDRSFVTALSQASDKPPFVQALVSLATALRLEVVAEGTESEEQARAMHELGCRSAQGYLYSGPLSAEEMDEVIAVAEERAAGRVEGARIIPLAGWDRSQRRWTVAAAPAARRPAGRLRLASRRRPRRLAHLRPAAGGARGASGRRSAA